MYNTHDLNLSDSEKIGLVPILEEVGSQLEAWNMTFLDESMEMVFYNHLAGLYRRICEKRFLEPMEEDAFHEITPVSVSRAEHIKSIFEQHQITPVDRLEVLLISTHLQNMNQ